ncbi:MAG: hypothetical protein JNK45_14020, partial [Myxococcales bacterium]|nr:hypothetical protein [Myxococcales bacterium]
DGCAGGPTSSWGEACGPAYDGFEDGIAPTSRVTAPEDRVRLDTAPGEGGVEITIDAEAADAGSGVATVSLVIDGDAVEGGTLRNPPWQWTVQLPRGVWEIRASARDWVGNDGLSAAIVVGVDEDPPPPPEASTSTGVVDDGGVDSSGGVAGSSGVADESSGAAGSVGADEGSSAPGCGCTATGRGGGWFVAGVVVLAWRRRRAGLVGLVLAACSDDGAQAPGSDSSGAAVPAGSSGADPVTGSSSGGDDSSSTTTTEEAGSSGEGPSCRAGALDCSCTAEFRCDAGLGCLLDTCVPCPAGTFACPCDVAEGGEEVCGDGLACFAGLCAAPEPCPFPMDGICDEPRAGGGCQPGTDAFDCCAAVPGVCEEASAGGECPEGSDPADCEGGSTGGTTEGESGSDGGSDGTTG